MQCWDSISQLSGYESPPLTTYDIDQSNKLMSPVTTSFFLVKRDIVAKRHSDDILFVAKRDVVAKHHRTVMTSLLSPNMTSLQNVTLRYPFCHLT